MNVWQISLCIFCRAVSTCSGMFVSIIQIFFSFSWLGSLMNSSKIDLTPPSRLALASACSFICLPINYLNKLIHLHKVDKETEIFAFTSCCSEVSWRISFWCMRSAAVNRRKYKSSQVSIETFTWSIEELRVILQDVINSQVKWSSTNW